jgi:hypothetical protein
LKRPSTLTVLTLLNVFALLFYFLILRQLHPVSSIPVSLFQTGDSREYLEYSQWLSGNHDYCSPVRTFFYPLLILITTTAFGNYGLWIVQLLFWLASCNLAFFTISRITNNRMLSTIGFFLCCTMVSPIGYTANALTETTVFFLLSLFIFTLAKNISMINNIHIQLQLLFIISLLAATKPVYQILWYISAAAFLFLSFRELKKYKIILLLLLSVSPVIAQKSISLATYNTLSSTGIADSNLKLYLYRKAQHLHVYGTIDNFDVLADSIHSAELKAAGKLSEKEAIVFLLKHPKETFLAFVDDLQNNIGTAYPLSNTPENKELIKWTQNINNKIMYLHLAAFILWLIFIFKNIHHLKNEQSLFILLSGLLLYYILFSSGLVFWSGDRLVAPATSLWICCYLVFGFTLSKGKNSKHSGEMAQ